MKTLSIPQPWAWLILNGGKDIENRTWYTDYRGPLLIHAALRFDPADFWDAKAWIARYQPGVALPPFEAFETGGVVGRVDVVDCVRHSASRWFVGPVGWVLENPQPLPFLRYNGMAGLFDIPDCLIQFP